MPKYMHFIFYFQKKITKTNYKVKGWKKISIGQGIELRFPLSTLVL